MSVDLVGRWDIVAFEQEYDDGRRLFPFGEHVEGFIRYLDDGDMVVFIAKRNRAPFRKGGQWNAPAEEKAAAYDSVLSYAGRWSVEGDEITHFVDYSVFPNWVGGVQKRKLRMLDDGCLALEARLEEGTSEARTARLVWRRHGQSRNMEH